MQVSGLAFFVALFVRDYLRTHKRSYRHGKDNADAARNAAYDLDSHICGAEKLIRLKPDGIQIDNDDKAAAYKREDERVRHRADHVAPDVHTGAEQLPCAELGLDLVYLRQRRGDTHGNVHHGAQGAYYNSADEKVFKPNRRSRLPKLQKRLDIGGAQAVNSRKRLRSDAEEHGDGNAADSCDAGADYLFAHAAENDERNYRNEGTHQKHRRQCGCALHEHGNEQPEQAHDGYRKPYERFCSGLAADEHRCRNEQQNDDDERGYPVILKNGRTVRAVGIGRNDHNNAVALMHRAAEKRSRVIGDLKRFALILPRLHLDKQRLLSAQCSVCVFVGLGVIREHLHDRALFILGILLRPLSLVGGSSPNSQRGKDRCGGKKYDNRPFIFAEKILHQTTSESFFSE